MPISAGLKLATTKKEVAMSTQLEANKQLVREFLTALGKGDVEELQRVLDPSAQAIARGTSFMAGTRGLDEILLAAGTLGSITKDGIEFEVVHFTAEEDRVAAEVKGYSTLVNGTPYDNEYHFLFTICDGRIVAISEYFCSKLVEDAFGPLLAAQA
jgi:ketosteroid isomerase-like protein